MLTAYFDDSGTHTTSDIVLVAGVFGTEWQLTSLERLWRPHIENPLCGRKPRLRRFHATDCHSSQGEFIGWSRTETDYFHHQLQTAIIDSGVSAYGMAILRKDWDEIVTGDMRGFLGDPEGYAISQCYVRALRWAQQNTFDPRITFVFDNRPSEVQRRAKAVNDAFERHTKFPQVTGCAFLSSYDILPLQAADLFAWEVYQHAKEIYEAGKLKPPERPMLSRLNANMNLTTQLAMRSSIQKIVDYVSVEGKGNFISQAADHFRNFDPSNPDYSYVFGSQPSETPGPLPPQNPGPRPRGRRR